MAWRKGYCYEYNGIQWIELDPALPGNRDKYMVALADLLADAPDGAFNNLFCMNLIAQKAFVRYLQALEITLSELTENGKTQRGSIKSQNYSPGQAGFKIDYNGDVEFNNGLFRGTLDVSNGVFRGELLSGPLSVSKKTPAPLTRNFAANATAEDIYNAIRANGIYNATGTYGNQNIQGIELSQTLSLGDSYPYFYTYTDYNVWVYIGNTRINIASTRITGRTNVTNNACTTYTSHSVRLGNALSVTITTTGMTFKMFDLPIYPAVPQESGTVYVDQNGFLKIVT
jgi:hypothetical protein